MSKSSNSKPRKDEGEAPKPIFRTNQNVVYPAHGVGRIVRVERQNIASKKRAMLVIYFEKDRMELRMLKEDAAKSGLRTLSSPDLISKALETLTGRAGAKRQMWSRRAQEYDQKINSGNLISIAEVVRDLHRVDQQSQSYSERQLYEQARDRLTREIAAVQRTHRDNAVQSIDAALMKKAA